MTEEQVRAALEQALVSLDAALETIHLDVEAATDDLLAARLLISTALVAFNNETRAHRKPDVAE